MHRLPMPALTSQTSIDTAQDNFIQILIYVIDVRACYRAVALSQPGYSRTANWSTLPSHGCPSEVKICGSSTKEQLPCSLIEICNLASTEEPFVTNSLTISGKQEQVGLQMRLPGFQQSRLVNQERVSESCLLYGCVHLCPASISGLHSVGGVVDFRRTLAQVRGTPSPPCLPV